MVPAALVSFTLNGQARRLPAPLTVAALVAAEGLGGKRVAVEVNQEIVPRSRHGETQIHEGDRVEIVGAIGGG